MVAELFGEEGVLKGLSLNLEEKEEWILGRDPERSNFVLEDLKVSREHVAIRKTEEGYLLENLSTTNPVLINDKEMEEPHLLLQGDKVVIGGTIFRFYAEVRPQLDLPEEKIEHETIFEIDELDSSPRVELQESSRFILKVLGGPNAGAEYALERDREYKIGSDATVCDIVFHDLSVSREHATLYLDSAGRMFIEDLQSRNGVVIDRERIEGKRALLPNSIVVLGTSVFTLIDRESPSATIITPLYAEEEPSEEEEPVVVQEIKEEEPVSSRPLFSAGVLLLTLILGGFVILLGVGVVSLFQEQEVQIVPTSYAQEIEKALDPFPAIHYNYNPATEKLFLAGNVSNEVEKEALNHNLKGLTFIKSVDNNVAVDDAIWQEMNRLLANHLQFNGVSMHSPKPGNFVLAGYLKTCAQKAELVDFMNMNFLYLDHLKYKIIVEDEVIEEVKELLIQSGFNGINSEFCNGQITLIGYIGSNQTENFDHIVGKISQIRGVRQVRNFVMLLSPEQAVVDLNERFPNRYKVTGYSKYGNVNINVVINGRILTRGDTIDEMTVMSIQPHTIFLEKEGLKYKLEYNK